MNVSKIKFKKLSNSKLLRNFLNFNFAKFIKLKFGVLNGGGYKPFSIFLGLRYTRAKQRNHFISFISLVSILGIALGVTVLITVLSVMNGFDQQIINKIFKLADQITVVNQAQPMTAWQPLRKKIMQQQEVIAAAPFVSGQGMLSHQGIVQPVLFKGVDPKLEKTVSALPDHMLSGKFSDLNHQRFGIILGDQLAGRLGVWPGQKVTLIVPKADFSPLGIVPRFKRFTVIGVFHAKGGFNLNSGVAFVSIKDAQALLQMGTGVTGLRLKVQHLFQAPAIARQLAHCLNTQVGHDYRVSNWTQQFGALSHAIQMEKTMMFIILILLVAIAAFNLVSTLVMVVTDKRAEIAILRTMGATPGLIMRIFIIQGFSVGILGCLLGIIGGVLLSLNITAIVSWIEVTFGVQLISASVYFVNFLPSHLVWQDVWHVSLLSLLLCLLATIYPAYTAAKILPAKALRYE